MLVLSRKLGEKIHLGPDIAVTLLAVKHNQVRLGIEAPADVPIHREELALATADAAPSRGTISHNQRPARRLPR